MDIRKWLDDTAEAESFPGPIRALSPNFFQHPEKTTPVFKGRHAPKRCKSDSSLLDTQPQSHKALPNESKPPTGGSTDASAQSDISRPSRSDSTESESSSHRYARKPRRKTRLERYKPIHVKEWGKRIHRSRRDESKPTKRKPRRNKGEKPPCNIVAQGSHAKNVSGDRLTLRPREQLGIFNKGKISMAVRGRGLPDLVFSEMKFLQKENNHPEPAAPPRGPSQKKRKKDHAPTKEGEISAFFTSVRPTLAKKESKVQTQDTQVGETRTAVAGRHERERSRSTEPDRVLSMIEEPVKGPYSELRQGPRHRSTSYVSWSDSVTAPEVAPQYPESGIVLDKNLSQHSKHRAVSTTMAGEDDGVSKQPTPHSDTRRLHASIEHFENPSVSEHDPHPKASRSQSCLQRISSPHRVSLVDYAASVHSTDSVQPPASIPPSIPVCGVDGTRHHPFMIVSPAKRPQHMADPHTRNTWRDSRSVNTIGDKEVDCEPQTSSDLDKVIEQCNHIFDERRRVSALRGRHTGESEDPVGSTRSESNPGTGVGGMRHVRFSGQDMASPGVPNFSGPSIYEQQAHRQETLLQASHHEHEILGDFNVMEQEYIDDADAIGMLDDESDWAECVGEPTSDGLDMEGQSHGAGKSPVSEDIVQSLASEPNIVGPGFWRPNRLY